MELEQIIKEMALIYGVEVNDIVKAINHLNLVFPGEFTKRELAVLAEMIFLQNQAQLKRKVMEELTPKRASEVLKETLDKIKPVEKV